MRTTLTLDPDVEVLLASYRKVAGTPLRKVINEALRAGIRKLMEKPPRKQPFRTPSADLGAPLIPSFECTGELLDLLDEEDAKARNDSPGH